MSSVEISGSLKNKLLKFLKENKKTDLVGLYLFFLEEHYKIKPILFPKEKKIYKGLDELTKKLEKEGSLYRETQITIQFGQESVNEETKKIYICPFTGKVFGDNTNPNPQDAIYDWVSKCKENTEIVEGLPAKRFFVSEDPEIIKNYMTEKKKPIKKTVFSSAITGKLFNSKEAVIEDFKKNQIKHLTIVEVQNQNKFEIEKDFLEFLQDELNEKKITAFVSALNEHKEFEHYLNKWINA